MGPSSPSSKPSSSTSSLGNRLVPRRRAANSAIIDPSLGSETDTMPIYEYQCTNVPRSLRGAAEGQGQAASRSAPSAAARMVKRISSPAIQFKGTGWYITDYAKKNSTPAGHKVEAGRDDKAGAKPETKSSRRPKPGPKRKPARRRRISPSPANRPHRRSDRRSSPPANACHDDAQGRFPRPRRDPQRRHRLSGRFPPGPHLPRRLRGRPAPEAGRVRRRRCHPSVRPRPRLLRRRRARGAA